MIFAITFITDLKSFGLDSAVSKVIATRTGEDSFGFNALFLAKNVKNDAAAILFSSIGKRMVFDHEIEQMCGLFFD